MEIRRLLSRRALLAGILIFLFQAAAFAGNQAGDVGFQQIREQNRQYYQEVERLKDKSLEESRAEAEILLQEERNEVSVALHEKIVYLSEYPQSIQDVLDNAERTQEFSIFQDPNSFTYANIIKTAQDFARMAGITLELDQDRATEHLLSYPYLPYFVLAFIVYVIYEILRERDNGMWAITRTMKRGRFCFAAGRGACLAVIAAAFYAICFGTNFLFSCFFYGADDFGGQIQTIQDYAKYPVSISKGGYIGMFFLKSVFSLFVMSALAYFVFTVIRSRNLAAAIFLAVLAGEWRLMNVIPVYSNLKGLRYLNLMQIFDCGSLDREYKNLNLLGKAVSASSILMAAEILLLAVSFCLTIFIYGKQYPKWGVSFLRKIVKPLERLVQMGLEVLPFTLKEAYKVLVSKKGIVLIAAGIIGGIWISEKSQVNFPDLQKDIDQAYLRYGGRDWSAFDVYIEELAQQQQELFAQADEMSREIRDGRLGVEKVMQVSALENRASVISLYLREFYAKQELRRTVKEEQGLDIFAMSDRGYNEIMGENSVLRELVTGVLLILVAILLASQTIGMEGESHTRPLLISSQRGIVWVWRRKVFCIFGLIGIWFLVLYGSNLWRLLQRYEIPYLEAPLQSITSFSQNTAQVTVLQYLIVNLIFKCAITFCAAAATLVISSLPRVVNRMYVPLLMVGFCLVYILLLLSEAFWLVFAANAVMLVLTGICIWQSYKNWTR